MVFEFTNSETPVFYADDQRSAMRTSQTPPPYTAVWLARCPDIPGFYTRLNSVWYSFTNGPMYRLLYFTFAYRHLVIQVVTVRPNEADQRTIIPYGDEPRWRDSMVMIWPTLPRASWPPSSSISEPDMLPFHNRYLSGLSTEMG
jgi:hypothetical protein